MGSGNVFPASIAEEAAVWYAGKEFTADWFTRHVREWVPVLAPRRQDPLKILEIGSYEGRSAVFWLEYMPRSSVVCIDIFSGSYEQRFDRNLSGYGARLEKLKGHSVPALEGLRQAGRRFDAIYIDGSHRRYDVLCDTVMAWPLLNVGGVLIWDDWGGNRRLNYAKDEPEQALQAIDKFCELFGRCLRVRHRRYQVIVEKTAEWPLPSRIEAAVRLPGVLLQHASWRIARWGRETFSS